MGLYNSKAPGCQFAMNDELPRNGDELPSNSDEMFQKSVAARVLNFPIYGSLTEALA